MDDVQALQFGQHNAVLIADIDCRHLISLPEQRGGHGLCLAAPANQQYALIFFPVHEKASFAGLPSSNLSITLPESRVGQMVSMPNSRYTVSRSGS